MSGLRVKYVREILGMTQAELAEVVGVQQSMVAMLERGGRELSTDLLERIADVTGFPQEFFVEQPKFEFPLGSLLFRKFQRLPAIDKVRSHRIAQVCFNAYINMAARLKTIPLRIPKRIEEDPYTAARLVRSGLGYDPDGPIRNLINRLERCGVVIIALPELIKDLDAFSTWVNGQIPVIVITLGKPGERQRFSIAHELGHLILHQSFQDEFDLIEAEANKFARELLFPEECARQELEPPITLSGLAELKSRWGLSIKSLVYCAYELGIISKRQRAYLYTQINQRGWNIQEPEILHLRPEKPRAFRQMAERLYGENINYKKLSEDLHLPAFWTKQIMDAHASKHEPPDTEKQSSVLQADFHHK